MKRIPSSRYVKADDYLATVVHKMQAEIQWREDAIRIYRANRSKEASVRMKDYWTAKRRREAREARQAMEAA